MAASPRSRPLAHTLLGGPAGRLLIALTAALALLLLSPLVASADAPTRPYTMIAHLQVHMPKGDGTCTGFMIGPHTVATAAHCVYVEDRGGWATSILITPGLDGLNAPYATLRATAFAVSAKWIGTESPVDDYAAITLDTNALGNATGWFDLVTLTPSEVATGMFAMAGYGSNVPFATLWRMPNPKTITDSSSGLLAYQWGTAPGDSGAPIFSPTGGERYRAVAIHHGALRNREGERVEYGPRVTAAMLDFYGAELNRSVSPAAQLSSSMIFMTPSGTRVGIPSPRFGPTHAGKTTVLQHSGDLINWTTIASATIDAAGEVSYTVTPTETRTYRLVVQGIGTVRLGRGMVTGGSVATPGATPAAGSAAGGRAFTPTPTYSSTRVALAVFPGGTAAQLEGALTTAGASTAWVQDAQGTWLLYVVGGGFLNDAFARGYPQGFERATPMTLVGR